MLVLRSETPLVSSHTKIVHSVRVSEETVVLRILLHVAPATSFPTAWNQVQLLIGHVSVHVVELILVDHIGHMLASNSTCVGRLIRVLVKAHLLSALEG